MNSSNTKYKDLVKYFGNQSLTAKALNCSQPSVWKWVKGKGYMSVGLAIKAEKITKGRFKAIELCPALAELEKNCNEAT